MAAGRAERAYCGRRAQVEAAPAGRPRSRRRRGRCAPGRWRPARIDGRGAAGRPAGEPDAPPAATKAAAPRRRRPPHAWPGGPLRQALSQAGGEAGRPRRHGVAALTTGAGTASGAQSWPTCHGALRPSCNAQRARLPARAQCKGALRGLAEPGARGLGLEPARLGVVGGGHRHPGRGRRPPGMGVPNDGNLAETVSSARLTPPSAATPGRSWTQERPRAAEQRAARRPANRVCDRAPPRRDVRSIAFRREADLLGRGAPISRGSTSSTPCSAATAATRARRRRRPEALTRMSRPASAAASAAARAAAPRGARPLSLVEHGTGHRDSGAHLAFDVAVEHAVGRLPPTATRLMRTLPRAGAARPSRSTAPKIR